MRAGHDVVVFEKSRGLGGRAATRRTPKTTFDHGAQYFEAHDARFVREVDSMATAGHVAPWQGRVVTIEKGRILEPAVGSRPVRYVGTPGMNAVAAYLGNGVPVRKKHKIVEIRRERNAWRLVEESRRLSEPFDYAIVTAPPEQAATLTVAAPALCERIARIDSSPCWAVMFTTPVPLRRDFDAAHVEDEVLSWICRNSSKPLRGTVESWVLHAAPGWSAEHLADEPEKITAEMSTAAARILGGAMPPLTYSDAHLWRYARTQRIGTNHFLWDPEMRIGACGDWCRSADIEGAYLSGLMLAREIGNAPTPAT
jgi:predicted NAD/FAD-dependent oxidoreductase